MKQLPYSLRWAATTACWLAIIVSCSGGSCSNTPPGSESEELGYFRDGRDQRVYKYTTIGTQTWMAENLNYDPGTGNSMCYDSETENCDEYGRLYDWATAMGLDNSFNSSSYTASDNHQGACPSGWHLPTDAEWTTLTDYVGGEETAGKQLKAADGWYNRGNGTDAYGFAALPGGYGDSGGTYTAEDTGFWWSASEFSAGGAYEHEMNYGEDYVLWSYAPKYMVHSVRCVKN